MWSVGDTVNTVLASVGIVVAIGGLIAVFIQIRKIRSATVAASKATKEARAEMVQHVTAAELGSTRMALRALRGELRTGGLEYALMSCDLIRESLVALYSRNAERIPEERREGLEDAVDAVRQIQQALERERSGSDVPLDIGDVNNRISELIDFVVDWQERPLSLGRETTDYEQRDA